MTDQTSGPTDPRARVSTEAERKTWVREWIARRFRRGGAAGTGLVGTLLTLPMIAAAQAADGFVSASQIDGVTRVQQMPDGSVRLGMSNGTTISVPASDVRVVNGDLLVSARVEDIAAEVMAAGGGAGGVGGEILGAVAGAGALAAAAAGGGGGGDGGDPLPVINSQVLGDSGGITSGNTGIDVPEGTDSVEVTFVDEDGNETTRTAEVDGDGEWTIPFDPHDPPPQGRITVTVTSRDAEGEELDTTSQDVIVDTVAPSITIDDTGVGDDGTLNIAEQDAGITVAGTTDAEDGQVVTVTVDGAEFTGTVSGGAWSVDIPPSGLAGLDPAAPDVSVTAEVSDAAGNTGLTFETIDLDLVAPTISLDTISGDNELGLIDTQGDLEITGTTDAEIGQPVTLTFDGQEFTGAVLSNSLAGPEPNAWSVTVPQSAVEAVEAGAEDGLASVDVSATVADAAGNPAATPATRTLDADFNGPSIEIDPIPTDNGDGVLNIAERDAGFEVSGTTGRVAEGSPVTVTVNGVELAGPVIVDADGNWSVTVGAGDAGTFPATGDVPISATVTDSTTGLPASAPPATLEVDLQAPTIGIFDDGLGDGVLNLAEQAEGITVAGTTDAEDGQIVTVQLYDGLTFVTETGPVSEGTWSVDIPPAGLAAYSGTGPLTFTANVSDAAGNPAPTATLNNTFDLVAPTISLDAISGDDVLGLVDTQDDLEITGTTDAEAGQEVTVTFDGQDFTGTVGSGGGSGAEPNAWSVTVPQSAVEAVEAAAVDGLATVDVSATVTDEAGNPAATPATRTLDADFNGPSIAIDPIAGDNIVNAEESGEDIIFSGTVSNVADTQDVTLDVGGVVRTVGISGGVWQTALTPAEAASAGIVDGATITVTADVSDADGLAAPTAEQTLLADFTAPVAFLDTIAEDTNPADDITDDLLNAEALANGMVLTGRATGAPGGTVELFFGAGDSTPTTVPVDGSEDWSQGFTRNVVDSVFPAGSGDRVQDFIVVAVDEAGNRSAPVTRTITLDVTPPTIAITDTGVGPDDILNIAERDAGITVEGTATGADGEDVTVTLSGLAAAAPITATGTVSGGTFAVDFTPAALAGIGAWSTAEVTAEVSDAAGNPATPATDSFDIDVTAPTIAITDTGVGPDDILNIAERDAGITVEGTATGAEGQTVTVTLSGSVSATPITATGTVSGGTFAVDFTPAALAGIGAWSMASVTAEVSDAAGNPATPATDSFDIDVTAPTITLFDPPPSGFVLDVEELADIDGIGFTSSGAAPTDDVTLTLTRSDGTVDFTRTEALGDIPLDAGVFEFPLTPADLAVLQDLTDYTASISVSDAAGNPASDSFGLETDFQPIVSFDEISEEGAIDLSDTADATLTGTTLGVEDGRNVTVTVTGTASGLVLTDTATVGADGTWSLTVAPAIIEGLTPGETLTFEAAVSNAAGRAADPATETLDAYLAAVYAVANTEEAGTTLTMTAFAAEGLDAVAGVEPEMSFDPGLANYVVGSATTEFDLFTVNDTNAATGFVGFIGGNLTAQIPEGEVIFGFDMEDQGAGPITLSFTDDAQGGPTELQIGTSGADTLTAANTDSVIQGKGGDDNIDVSATGTNIIVFGLDQASNGTDSVTGFTTGTGFQSDVIAFLGEADLRGAGDVVDSLAAGGAIGTDTGFVIFTTALADTGNATIETALEGLTGEGPGDVFYGLAGDGSDAALVRATVNGADDISLERMADFTGIGDLGNLSEDNVILPDPASAPVA